MKLTFPPASSRAAWHIYRNTSLNSTPLVSKRMTADLGCLDSPTLVLECRHPQCLSGGERYLWAVLEALAGNTEPPEYGGHCDAESAAVVVEALAMTAGVLS